MYFQESEAIALEHPDLVQVVDAIDGHLASIFTHAPLRPGDFACVMACDENQVVAVFDLLADREVLDADTSVECKQCHNLMPHADFQQAMEDEDEFECTNCGRPFHRHTPVTTVYRMSAETLARPKPAVKTDDVESALRHLDGHKHVFQRMGQIWVLKYDGKMVLMEHAKGMMYLSRLLIDPDRTIPVAFLVAAETGDDPRIFSGSSEEVIDNQAMVEYKQRYVDLQVELTEAENRNDLSRIPQLQEELDSLGNEIVRVSGLGGRVRSKSEMDKVRKRVSTAVKRAIDSIRAEHPRLGRHLHNAVNPGFTFSYTPERDPRWFS